MDICKECGTNVPDSVKFCTDCGNPMEVIEPVMAAAPAPEPAPVESVPAAVPVPAPVTEHQQPVQQYTQPTPDYSQQPAYSEEAPPPPTSKYAPISTGAYIGFSLLFSLPLIGPIICIIMSFTAKRVNLRNYARAMLIFLIIGLIVSIGCYFLMSWATESIMAAISGRTGVSGMTGSELDEFMNWIDLLT